MWISPPGSRIPYLLVISPGAAREILIYPIAPDIRSHDQNRVLEVNNHLVSVS